MIMHRMKFAFCLSIVVIFMVASCSKDKDPVDPPPLWYPLHESWGLETADINKNGYSYVGTPLAIVSTTDLGDTILWIQLHGYTQEGALRDRFGVAHLPLDVGHHKVGRYDGNPETLAPWAHYSTFMSDGDVPEDRYLESASHDSWIEVSHLDTTQGQGFVVGSYELHYSIDQSEPKLNPDNPDEVEFSGYFEITLQD